MPKHTVSLGASQAREDWTAGPSACPLRDFCRVTSPLRDPEKIERRECKPPNSVAATTVRTGHSRLFLPEVGTLSLTLFFIHFGLSWV